MSISDITGNELFSTVELRAKPGQADALVEIGHRFMACLLYTSDAADE